MRQITVAAPVFLALTMTSATARAGDDVLVTKVRFELSGQKIIIHYDLQGPADNTYRVKLLLKRKQLPAYEYGPRSLSGDVGEGKFTGANRQIVWEIQRDSVGALEGADFYFVVEAEMLSSRSNLLWYVGGGAAVVAGAAAVILGRGKSGGNAIPDVFPKPVGRPSGN